MLRDLRREVSKAPAETDALTEELEATGVLTCTLDREDAWLLEATRALLDQFGTRGAEAQIEALLAEAQGALLAALPAASPVGAWKRRCSWCASRRRRRSSPGSSALGSAP
jgi:hypothetical protein